MTLSHSPNYRRAFAARLASSLSTVSLNFGSVNSLRLYSSEDMRSISANVSMPVFGWTPVLEATREFRPEGTLAGWLGCCGCAESLIRVTGATGSAFGTVFSGALTTGATSRTIGGDKSNPASVIVELARSKFATVGDSLFLIIQFVKTSKFSVTE